MLNRVRVIINDSEIAGGDVLTDSAPFSFEILNGGFERVQSELVAIGDETFNVQTWLIGLPVMPTVDPEARLVIDDTGTHIIYPNGTGNANQNSPALPDDMVVPLRLWERQNGTANFAPPMKQPNGGLVALDQQLFLVDWEWKTDGLRFRGAMQSQDVRLEYRKQLPKLVAPTDPVPIRGVLNAAAYHASVIFTESRGGMVAPQFKLAAQEEMVLAQKDIVRRRQRKQVRRRPYAGRGGRSRAYLSSSWSKTMAATVQISAVQPAGDAFEVAGFIVLSGTYPTGGDPLNFAAAVADPSFIGLLPAFIGSAVLQADVWSMNGATINGGNSVNYDVVVTKTGTPAMINPATGVKLKVAALGSSPTTEHSAAAYESQYTGDIIAFQAVFTRLL